VAVPLAITMDAVVAVGIVEEVEAVMTVLAHPVGTGIPVAAIGAVRRATGLVTAVASNP
jgi:hypothetical protein